MSLSDAPIITLLLAVPAVGALLLLVLDERRPALLKSVALAAALIDLVLSLPLFFGFSLQSGAVQFAEQWAWVPALGA
ncbi:MAG: Fe-S-binding domain-containing protein, partial [Anaerolineae bacterium]|nr:Fe-S-binding domain-containing protein [Anaerolineae bacterium]